MGLESGDNGLDYRTRRVVRNSFNRTYLETAFYQKSPNKDFLVKLHLKSNKKNEWIIVKVLKKHTKLRSSSLQKVLDYYRFGGILNPYYLKRFKEWEAGEP